MAEPAEFDLSMQGYVVPDVQTGAQLHQMMLKLHEDIGWDAVPALGLLIQPEGGESPMLTLTVFALATEMSDPPSPVEVFPQVVVESTREMARQGINPRQILAFAAFLVGSGYLGGQEHKDTIFDGEEGALQKFIESAEPVEFQSITTIDVSTGERFESSRVQAKDDGKWIDSDPDQISGGGTEVFTSLAMVIREFNQENRE